MVALDGTGSGRAEACERKSPSRQRASTEQNEQEMVRG